MLQFAHINYLWGLAAVPLFILLFLKVRRWKKRALAGFGDQAVVLKLMPEVSLKRPATKFVLFLAAYIFLVVGIADPRIGSKLEEVKQQSADLMILLDVSNSMLAADVAPSRLESAKRSVSRLISSLHHDRIGIVVFAGEAYVQLPMTTDYAAAKLFLNTISPAMVPTQGTAIGAAIAMGMKSFDFSNGTGKAMIVITDGENHEDDAVAAARAAAAKEVNISVIGIGSAAGAAVPVYREGRQAGFHTDSLGREVISKLDEGMCRSVAAAGQGAYVRATSADSGMDVVMQQIGKIQRKTLSSKNFREYEDRFQIFLAVSLLLLLAEFFLSNRKNQRLGRLNLFEVKSPAAPVQIKKT